MKRLVSLSLFLAISLPISLNAQKIFKPSPEDIELAKKLKKTYETEDEKVQVVGLNIQEEYTFGFDNKSQKVTVTEESKTRLICVDDRLEMPIVEFYNIESSIEDVTVLNKKGKKKKVELTDEYYNDEDFFYTDARVVYFPLKFPAQGYQYQVNFKKKYKDVKYFTSTYFSSAYPVEKKEIIFVIPRWLEVELKGMNFEGFNIKQKKTYDAKKDADVYTFIAEKQKPRISEDHSQGPTYLYPHILVLAKSYTKNGAKTPLFSSTQDLYDWYKGLVDSMNDDNGVLKAKVEEITKNADTDLDIVRAIYYWVQDNIRYIAFEDGIAGFKPDECQNVYNNKYGDCKGMANLTKQMLQLKGIDARLTWIGTRRIAYDYSMPCLAVDNHMICTVILDGEKYFLDPTEKYNPFQDYAERIQGKQALIEDGASFILERVPVISKDNNTETIKRSYRLDGEVLKGASEHVFAGESKARLLYQINQTQSDQREDAIKRYLTAGDKNLKVSDLSTSDVENRDQNLRISYELERNNAVSSFGDELYLDLDFFKEFNSFELDEKRKTDSVFSHKINMVTEIEVEIPEGYKVQQLPTGFREKHEDFTFAVSFKQEGNKLQYIKEISVDNALLEKEDFDQWNICIGKLTGLYEEQVVLSKAK